MRFDLSDEQIMLRTAARSFLGENVPPEYLNAMSYDEKGFTRELWHRIAEMGWLGLVIPEQYGGFGGSILDMCVLAEEFGRAALPGPYLPTVATSLILLQGSDDHKRDILPAIAEGRVIATHTVTENPLSDETADNTGLRANVIDTGHAIDGTALFVPDAHVADYIVCHARSGANVKDLTLYLVRPEDRGIGRQALKTISGRKECEVVFESVRVTPGQIVGELSGGRKVLRNAIPAITLLSCAEMLGGAQHVFETAVDYAKQRIQFGRLIGSFQAIAHHCANMKIYLDTSRALIYKAAWAISEGMPAWTEVSMAKAHISTHYKSIAFTSHHILGANSFQEELPLHYYLKRAQDDQVTYGTIDEHLESVAAAIGLR